MRLLLRVWEDITKDRVFALAGGVAYYGLLALFPQCASGSPNIPRCHQCLLLMRKSSRSSLRIPHSSWVERRRCRRLGQTLRCGPRSYSFL
jgi:hypothetical protein